MEKINFQNNITKLNKETMDTFQDNIDAGLQTKQDKINAQWQSATVNSEYAEGLCSYLTFGNILIIKIMDLKVTKKVSHNNMIISGLPQGLTETVFMVEGHGADIAKRRLKLQNNGTIVPWYDSIGANNNVQYYGTTIAIYNN